MFNHLILTSSTPLLSSSLLSEHSHDRSEYTIKVVIITNLEQKQKSAKNAKNTTDLPKLYRCLLYVVFHNLKPQNAGLVSVKKDLNSKRSKGIFVRENLKK